MDYLYENLGDERFQEFCSCLVSKEFPNFQSFPVGQPDGGRDSLVFLMQSNIKEFNVFQVKYVRNPNQERDIHKWFEKTIKEEAEKINKLIPKGARNYYLLTNVRGTAHLGSGSKDKVNKILETEIKIPSICWWRDDLSILFEKDPLFKWSFPEILNGQDVLNSVLFANLNENKSRRENVITAYLTDQFEIDNEVKFKQIDLQNKLLNLFTDVPIKVKKYNVKNEALRRALLELGNSKKPVLNDDFYFFEDRQNLCAAEFLLHPKVQSNIERILLEGGPGQGKSTISQYICQIHRTRLLNKVLDIELIPPKIKFTPIRLPFKIDIRDVAAWIEKKNPYNGILSEEYFNNIWKNSLESFFVAHIFFHSKLEEFTTTDFIAICKISPVLIVFDGFDEIANIKLRSEVIDFINKGIARISSNSKSIQVIITSRPAAFSDSVGFSIEYYPHFELTDITTPIINEYVEKWIKSSKIEIRDANELRKLIKEKLELPHLKDLAKSPMQLAIFISLLKTKGQSLPNKRTALYDSYIELLFDRESEKNNLIRDKRDLIIEIHQYLAWLLHSEAELLKNNGNISIEDLHIRLKKYLNKEGHDVSISEQLFTVMKERVCALVSRVQGTFEFEVQPLREYFCAKFLYKSAPHSSAGNIKQGTKPDRLNAILRNYYWQNVVRFFAGCADAGELDMIIQELKDLQKDPLLEYTNYPSIITAQILSDYVFTQKPLKLKDVVKIIVNGINIGNIINQDKRYSSTEPIILPNDCGRKEIVEECFTQLHKFPRNDYANELISIINNNPVSNLDIWMESISKFKGEKLTKWLSYAYRLQLIHKIDQCALLNILNEGDLFEKKRRLHFIISGNRIDFINDNLELKQIVFTGILDNELSAYTGKMENSLSVLTILLNPYILSNMISQSNRDSNISFLNYLMRFGDRHRDSINSKKLFLEFDVKDGVDECISSFNKLIGDLLATPISKFKNENSPWDQLIESGRKTLKDNWALIIVATIAAGIKSKEESYEGFIQLHNPLLSLSKRVRCARLKSGNVKYWKEHFKNSENILFTLLVFFTWSTPKVIIQLLTQLSKIIKSLKPEEFSKLIIGLSSTSNMSLFNKTQQKYIEENMKNKLPNNEINYILSLRFSETNGHKYIYNNIKKFSGVVERAIDQKFQYLILSFLKEPENVDILKEIKSSFNNTYNYSDRYFFNYIQIEKVKIPYEIAKQIMKECKEYPLIISSFAEKACRLFANQNTIPIGEIALKQNWFENN